MTAYFIAVREGPVHDPAEMQEYSRKTREIKGDFKLTPLSVYGQIETLEGQAPDGVIILQFPSVEAARAWYHSPGYQAALPHRQKAADYRVMIVDGL